MPTKSLETQTHVLMGTERLRAHPADNAQQVAANNALSTAINARQRLRNELYLLKGHLQNLESNLHQKLDKNTT